MNLYVQLIVLLALLPFIKDIIVAYKQAIFRWMRRCAAALILLLTARHSGITLSHLTSSGGSAPHLLLAMAGVWWIIGLIRRLGHAALGRFSLGG